MITSLRNLLENRRIDNIIIPAEKVAHVSLENSVEHALLVLTKSGYSMIPVLDLNYKLYGLISNSMILDAILGEERIEFERLSVLKVHEVMNSEIPRMRKSDVFSKGLTTSIDHPFVCIEGEDGTFEGILTRREVIKQLNKEIRILAYQPNLENK